MGASVLLVDDHQFTRVTLGTALASRALDIHAVGSAREALALAYGDVAFDVAVLDLDLGTGPTGLDLAMALRERLPWIGIVLLTGYRDPRLASAHLPSLPVGGIYLCKENLTDMDLLVGAISLVLRQPLARRASAFSARTDLTDVQVEVFSALASGATTAQIARDRGVSEGAIEKTIARICQRLGIESDPHVNQRVQLVQVYNQLRGQA